MNKHLEFYNQCMKTGWLPVMSQTGLCGCANNNFISKELLNIFKPTDENKLELRMEGLSVGWWASEAPMCDDTTEYLKLYGFNELRQTIVAFMAVITLEDFR